MERNEKYHRARKRVKGIRGFYHHLAIYVAVMLLLLIVDLSDGGNWWCYWPAIGWGIFVVLNAFSIRSHGVLSDEWEEKKIREMMEKE